MYRIPINKLSALKSKIGKVCTATSGQPCEELHGSREITLNDGSKVMLCHAVNAKGTDIVNSAQLSYPKSLETKADYLYVVDFFDKTDWESDFQTLLNDRLVWINVGELDIPEDGIIDKWNEVREIDGIYYQYKYKEDPDCKLFRLGFTIDEVKKIIEDEIWQ